MAGVVSELRGSVPEPGAGSPGRSESALGNGGVSDAFALLAELTQGLAHTLDVDTTLGRALERIVDHVGAEAGSLWVLDPDSDDLLCRAQVGPGNLRGHRLSVHKGIIGRSVRENACQLVAEPRRDPGFFPDVDARSGFVTRSIVCAPLGFGDRALGAIQLVNKRGGDGRFSEVDRHLLRVLASSAALALVNARMASQAVEHERVRRELELAAEIQRSLLPAPRPEPFPVHGVNVPARSVSGDFFDVLELDASRIAFCLGDVSGKGLNAALLATKTASLYRYLTRTLEEPGRVLQTLNDELAQTATRGMFVTMTAGLLHRGRGVVCVASAGHEPALLHDARGEFASIPAQAPPLAVLPDQFFPESELRVDGSTLYVFSDGLTEASCGAGERLGAAGVRRLIERFAARPLHQRIAAILADVQQLDLRDDLTILGVGCPDPAGP
jgi:sigma-B regulation protein RsbU (phosphoserine phosphatase)